MTELIANLTANKVAYGRIWLDVETDPSTGCQWSATKATNCAFMTQLVAAAQASGVPFGVYSSTHMWCVGAAHRQGSLVHRGSCAPPTYTHTHAHSRTLLPAQDDAHD